MYNVPQTYGQALPLIPFSIPVIKHHVQTVAYLGFQKEGAKFSLATSAHTMGGGANQVFQFFYYVKKNFFANGGHGTMAYPLNTPSAYK